MWRVMSGKHKSLEYSMMEAGHTKFHPDWHFGLWKVSQNKLAFRHFKPKTESFKHAITVEIMIILIPFI